VTETAPPAGPAASSWYRREALEHRTGSHLGGAAVRLDAGWIRWPAVLLMAATGATLGFGLVARLPVRVAGPAVVAGAPGGSGPPVVLALVPAGAEPRPTPGSAIEFLPDSGAPVVLAVHAVGLDGATPVAAGLRCALEARAARDRGTSAPSLLLEALPGPADAAGRASAADLVPGTQGRVRMTVGRQRVILALFPDLEKVWPRARG
jgi:hypothetical protein